MRCQVSLQSGAHYVHPLAPKGPIGQRSRLESNLQPNLATLQPSLPIKATHAAGQVHPQAGLPGVWANHYQELKDPCPGTDLGNFLSRSVMPCLPSGKRVYLTKACLNFFFQRPPKELEFASCCEKEE